MNAIVSLCHFCEIHGPSILFCTQPFHVHNNEEVQLSSLCSGENLLQSKTSNASDATSESDATTESQVVATESNCHHTSTKGKEESLHLKSEIKCEACRSFPPSTSGFFSNDLEAQMRYMSSQHPSHTQVFSMVRQACLRSLSSEVSPDRDGPGPIFFGDENSGYVLSHVFIIKDSQYSRGFQRRYSIIVVMMDKIFLLNSWPFLVKHIKTIIDELQAKALKVYEAENAQSPVRTRSTRPGASRTFMPHGPIAPGKPARSFIELTGDKRIFQKLHQTFIWLLKAGGNRLTEKLLEGPPTEDSIVDIENQEVTEEGFVLVESKREGSVDESFEEHAELDAGSDSIEKEDCPVFQNLRHLLRVFGYSKFHQVSHHVAIGNQIIIRGRHRKLIMSAIDCLKLLLPKGCCKVIYFSKCYQESWRCNFLGLAKKASIPTPVEPYVLVDIHEPDPCPVQQADDSDVQDAMLLLGLDDKDFSGYVFTVESPAIPEKGPTVLEKMEFVLMNDTLAYSVVEQCIVCLKEEWMNKVKVLFKFTRAGGSRSEDDTQGLLRVVGAEEDKHLLKFWREGLSTQYKKHMLASSFNQSES